MVDAAFLNAHVVRSTARQKTLSLEVLPTGDVCVRVPLGCDESRIQNLLNKRKHWIAEQQAFFRRFDPRTPARAWVLGETHLHLGRRYKLRIELGDAPGVRLLGSDLLVTIGHESHKSPAHIESMVRSWRHQEARVVLYQALIRCHRHHRFADLPVPVLRVQHLTKRWGSLSNRGLMTLHTDLVQAAQGCIDYVVFHELCHLIHPDHSRDFFRLLSEVCPPWMDRKQTLESTLQ